MKKLVLISSLLFSLSFAFAQQDLASKYAAIITGTELKKHLSIIANDYMEGRETGTEGQRRAAFYIEAQFRNMGLLKAAGMQGYQQLYPLFQDSLKSAEFSVNGKPAQFGTDFIMPLNSNETGSFKGKKIVFVGYGIDDPKYNDYAGLNVKGKIVVFFLGEPKKDGKYLISGAARGSEWSFPGLAKKLTVAAEKGAVAALFINPNQESFTPRIVENGKRTGVYFPKGGADTKKVHAVQLANTLAKTLLGNNFDTLLKQIKQNLPIDQQWKTESNWKLAGQFEKYRNTINASNVLGIIEGTDKKDEYVFLTGHYDHLGKHDGKIYYGADDDGSGTCAVLEMATAFTKAVADGYRPRRTLVFMTVSGEEKGLWGSEYYSDHPIYPLEKTSVDLNTDMIGRVDTERKTDDTLNYVYVIGHNKLSTELQGINEAANNANTKLVLDYKFDDPTDPNRIYYRSDHYNFARKGVPILFFYDGMLKADYHKPTDTIEKINWSLYEKRARMIFLTAWEIANRDEMLKRDIPLQ